MKHLLNNMSEQEKNSIREQHTDGIKVMTENFSKLLNSKLGDIKPFLNEQTTTKPTVNTEKVSLFDLSKISEIFSSMGFRDTPKQGYKLYMVKGKDKVYIPLKQENNRYGYTDGTTPQLWITQQSNGGTYDEIYDMNPQGIIHQRVQNGRVMSKELYSPKNFYMMIQSNG